MKLTLFVNHRCNLRCRYCYTGRKFDRPMPARTMRRAIDFGVDSARKKYILVSFFGGEPTLELDLVEQAMAYARGRAARAGLRPFFAIATNGTVVNARLLRLLRDNDVNVQVSYEGCPEAQDATRRFRNGRSSAARVEAGLKRLLGEGFDVRVISVVDPDNARFMARGFDRLMDLGVRRIHLSPNYTAAWDDDACDGFEHALGELGERYMARFRAHQDVRLDPLNGKVVTHLAEGYKEKNLCQFGQQELAVAPSGNLYPCDRLVCEDDNPDIQIGDVVTGLDTARRDAMVQAKNRPDDECSGCELQRRCMHWCGCANYETTGDVATVSPVVCWFERCWIAEADRVANTLFAERNPTFVRRFYVPEMELPAAPAP